MEKIIPTAEEVRQALSQRNQSWAEEWVLKPLHAIKRLGIMGGTFDPIHYGHLTAAEVARLRFQLDRVVFVPSGRPPHKQERRQSDPEHRFIMTTLATLDNPHFHVSRLEIEREGLSYAYETVRHFQQEYGPHCEIFFITGADAILEILSWRNVEQLLANCAFIAATRPGYDLAGVEQLPAAVRQKISLIEIPALSVSSTDIRQRNIQKESIRYLLPESVEYYIVKQGLYRE